MRLIKNKKVNNINLKFNLQKFDDYIKLDNESKEKFDKQLKNVLLSIDYNSKEIERYKNDFVYTCQNGNEIVGFIHLVPLNSYDETSLDRFNTRKMFVDYVAVNPKFQGYGIATNLYMLSVDEMKQNKVKEISAILFDEYSRRAFCKVMKKYNMPISENSLDGSITAHNEDFEQEK